MKEITNWQNATVFDTETDGLLNQVTKFHVLSCQLVSGSKSSVRGGDLGRLRKFFQYHLNNNIPVVAHNGISFDVPVSEKLLDIDLSKLMVIDTLYLSWYLNIGRKQHGLDSFLEDYGIPKPPIENWEDLTYEEYKFRCESDVGINVALWEDFKTRLLDMYTKSSEAINRGLVDGKRITKDEYCYLDQLKGSTPEVHISRLLTFIMYKADTAYIRESTKIKLDVGLVENTIGELELKLESARVTLEGVMPEIPKYAPKKKPAKPFKKDGSLSASGVSWNEAIGGLKLTDDKGTPLSVRVENEGSLIKVLKSYEPPNINSSQQIKDFLFLHGWKPRTFKYVKDSDAQQAWVDSGFRRELKPKPRAIPQVSKDGEEGKELCPSVSELSESIPEIKRYANYTLLKHRRDALKGFINNMDEGGYVYAGVKGITNTMREQHRVPIVNLPGVDKPYGDKIRGALTCEEGFILLGSDLSSLEDRVKHHFMTPHDPGYVATMMHPDYDSHIHMALTANMVTQDEYDRFLMGDKTENAKAKRKLGKTANYSLVYGASPDTLSINSGMSKQEAKILHKAYWDLNWAVKTIAEDQYTFEDSKGLRWLVNPINGFCYSIRANKDIFSTLIQGTGSFFFDMWVSNILEDMFEKYSKKMLALLMHDEFALKIRDLPKFRKEFSDYTFKAIDKVNETFKLRRDLGCDVVFGKTYADIH